MPALVELQNIQGFPSVWQGIQTFTSTGSIPSQFNGTEVLSGVVWSGGTQAPMCSLTVVWSNGGLGYSTGIVDISLTAGLSTTWDTQGDFHIQCYASRGGLTIPIVDCLLTILPAPGTTTQLTPTYCSYQDMLDEAQWIENLSGSDAYQEGFYTQRLKARQWLDGLIEKAYKGSGVFPFGDTGVSASMWSGSGAGFGLAPSFWLRNILSGGVIVLNSLVITTPGSGYTIANAVFTGTFPAAGIPSATVFVSGGQCISIGLVNAGYGINGPITVAITGDGHGATAICQVTTSSLMIRPQVIRMTAYKAIGILGLAQIGTNNQLAAVGAYFESRASAEIGSYMAEIDLNGDTIADLAIPLGITNTRFV